MRKAAPVGRFFCEIGKFLRPFGENRLFAALLSQDENSLNLHACTQKKKG